jgi:hypothetical protein
VLCAGIGLIAALCAGCSADKPDSTGPTGPPGSTPAPVGSTPAPAQSGTPGSTPGTPRPTVSAPAPKAGTVHLVAVELLPEDPYPGGQLVVLVNGGAQPADVTCWTVRSAGTGTAARILTQNAVPAGGSLRLLPESVPFDSVDTLSLLDRRGQLVDRTPELTDRARDDQLWFRQPSGTWTFGRGFRLPEQVADGRLVTGPSTC